MNGAIKTKYQTDFRDATIHNENFQEVNQVCRTILNNIERYEDVSNETRVPPVVVGAIHMRESDFDFRGHLFNGDPLTARTVHEPKGQPNLPPANGLVYTWEESAIAAMKFNLDGWNIDPAQTWGIAESLYFCETYNGMGYRKLGVPSPYLWSYTDKYKSGLFVADGQYEAKVVNQEAGCAAIFKMLGC